MTRACGIVVFADEALPSSTPEDPSRLPDGYTACEPCKSRGHADALGRGVRNASGSCIGCVKLTNAKRYGHDEPLVDLDELVGLAFARERRVRDEAAKKIARAKQRRSLGSNARGQSKNIPSNARLVAGTACVTCGKELTRAAVEGGSRECSRACAGLVTEPTGLGLRRGPAPKYGSDEPDDGPDVSDAELAEIGS